MRPRRPTCRLRRRGEMKFVLFDLDDTLTDRHASLERYVARLLPDFAEELGPVEATRVLAAILEVDERGYAPRERVFTRLQTALAWRSVPELIRLADHWREQFPRSTVLRPGALDTLIALREQGFTLGLVTNGPVGLQQGKIDEVGSGDCSRPSSSRNRWAFTSRIRGCSSRHSISWPARGPKHGLWGIIRATMCSAPPGSGCNRSGSRACTPGRMESSGPATASTGSKTSCAP